MDTSWLLWIKIYYETEAHGRGYEKYPLYYLDTFIGFANIIFPLIVGLWANGWVLEDTGLMHFKLPKENEAFLYEIEPIYLKYNSFVKGYAGISSIFYLVTAIIFYISYDLIDVIALVLSQIIFMMFFIVPAYFFHLLMVERLHKKLFRKGMQEVPIISQENYLKTS
ncbi:MAG: membrane protein of unknown function [Promethearchaeota archaeon]|nr:MAG: membrane protein of unknown function [Candidatus Lokiarchaeota archaeon]